MLRSLIASCLTRRPLALVALAAFLGLGYAAFTRLNIEAYPDPTPPIIEIIAQNPGQSPEEMERYVTIPIEIAIASTPGLKYLRSNTVFALSFVRVQFEYGRDYYFVRQQLTNRLKDVQLPSGVQPVISPAGTVGEIIRYELKGPPGVDLITLKTLQDWVVEPRLRLVPGISDVIVLGGKTKQYQVEVNLDRMRAYGLTLPQITNAISTSNSNVGGRTIALGEQSVNVRGLGAVQSTADIGNVVIAQYGGLPVLLSDVASVQIGFAPRLGIAGRDGDTDILFGVVLMQKFERTMEVVTRVRAAIERLNTDGTLPAGVKIDAFYDRGDLVAVTVNTVLHNMLFGIVLIFLIQWLFLGDLRCALIVASTIPVALSLAVIITVLRGESANLLSIGAIDLGIIVDASVIMVENVFRHFAEYTHRHPGGPPKTGEKLHRVLTAAVEVDRPILFSVLITVAAFIPLFTMQGVEGQIFGPMARTYAYALIGAVVATFTVTPVMASILLPERVQEVETFVVRNIRRIYQPLLGITVRNARLSAMIAVAFLLLCVGIGSRLGTEFLPKLEEGNLWIRALLPPTITLEAGVDTVGRIRGVIASYSPVRTVVSEQGRGEDATDPDGSFVAEFFVPLKPTSEWPSGLTKEQLVRQLSDRLQREFVGIDFNFSQYIQDNIEEAVSGVKGENSVKIFGPDLAILQRLSEKVKDEIAKVPGVNDPGAFNLLGQPNLVVRIDRAKAARYGFSISDINAVVQAAIGGQEVTRVYEGERNFALTVRLAPKYRSDMDAIRSIPVALPNSDPTKWPPAYISLGDLADVRLETGAAYIYRENAQRFVPLKYSVRNRDLGSTVAEAQERIERNVPLPPGYRMEWAGEYGALVDAKQRLAIIVPVSLILIMMLLYTLFNSVRDSLLALAGIPFAVAGGILGLYVAGLNFSVSAAVGFISLFGVSAMDGILLLSYIRRDLEQGKGSEESIIDSAQTRMRQIFMTGFSACIGLVPAAISTGIGSQVQQPLACVIVGGMLLSPICSLLVIPTLARLFLPQVAESGGRAAEEHPAPRPAE